MLLAEYFTYKDLNDTAKHYYSQLISNKIYQRRNFQMGPRDHLIFGSGSAIIFALLIYRKLLIHFKSSLASVPEHPWQQFE